MIYHMYEDMYASCPEEQAWCDADIDYMYDSLKDEAILCSSNEDALRLHSYGFTRHLPEIYQYYIYTVECREANTFPLNIELWRHSKQLNLKEIND